MNYREMRLQAKEVLNGCCRMCADCDGKICAGEVPGMGGTGSGVSFRNNVEALRRILLNMRIVHGVQKPDMSTEIFGMKLRLPILAAPIGGVSFNMANMMPEQDYIRSIIGGCREAGIAGCSADGPKAEMFDSGLEALREHEAFGIPFIKPWDGSEFDEKLARCAEAGCKVVGSDIDSVGMAALAKMGRPASPKTPEQLAVMVEKAHNAGMKFIAKGIMSSVDAFLAHKAGCDGIVVSNHGGRVLDGTPGTANVLPGIAALLKGKLTILADGGIRSGEDVLKMIALGADAVLIGRPFAQAVAGGGKEGISLLVRRYANQLSHAMLMTGCGTIAEIDDRAICR